MFAISGAVAMWLLMKSDYRQLRVISPLLMLGALLSLAAVLVPGVGLESNGATRWIRIGGPMPPVQPSEFAKLALIIYVSAWLAGRGENVKELWTGFLPFVVLVGIAAGLIMLEPRPRHDDRRGADDGHAGVRCGRVAHAPRCVRQRRKHCGVDADRHGWLSCGPHLRLHQR